MHRFVVRSRQSRLGSRLRRGCCRVCRGVLCGRVGVGVDVGGYGCVVILVQLLLVAYVWERDGFVSFVHLQHLHEDLY